MRSKIRLDMCEPQIRYSRFSAQSCWKLKNPQKNVKKIVCVGGEGFYKQKSPPLFHTSRLRATHRRSMTLLLLLNSEGLLTKDC